MKFPCPDCGVKVEARYGTTEGNYPGALVFRGVQVRRGPEHRPRCVEWRSAPSEERK